MDLMHIIGKNTRVLRTAQGLSQEELAARAGMQRTYIGDIERGERNITLSSLSELAAALRVHPTVLLTEDAFTWTGK